MRKSLYSVIFLVSLATLALEITLTRIFSVTMWYHYAFMAISVAMLGMSTGSVKVYVSKFTELSEMELYDKISSYSVYFGFSTLLSLLTLLSIPFVPRNTGVGIFSMALVYIVAAVPFFFSGVVIAAVLTTRFVENVGKLYAADLIGAALGAFVFYLMMSWTDAVTVVIVVSLGGFLSAFAIGRRRIHLFLVAIFLLLAIHNHTSGLFRIEWAKVEAGVMHTHVADKKEIEWEKWTPFSRITVGPYTDYGFGWGISHEFLRLYPHYRIGQKNLIIDAAAATVMTEGKEAIGDLYHLAFDITNLAHHIVKDGRVAVIGVGGGRDILSALHFRQKEVWGIEINSRILEALTDAYSKFTYDFKSINNVHLVNDEARSFIERSEEKFDMIQASLIDSWAATASGAFVLTENSLYTVEGWKVFLDHLSDRGVVTMSRWYYKKRPGELLRLTNLAYESLREYGVEDPSRHILLAATTYSGRELPEDFGTGTIIVSKKPFSDEMISRFMRECDRLKFKPLLAAGREKANMFQLLTDTGKRAKFIETYPLNLSAPTDDSPFFFNMLRPGITDKFKNIEMEGPLATNLKAVTNLVSLLAIVFALALLLIVLPLWITMEKRGVKLLATLRNPYTFYFMAIGLGFMLIEIALLQKFTVFLGHPTYSIMVVLFTVLTFTGIGSFFSSRLQGKLGIIAVMGLLLAVVTAVGGINMFILPKLGIASMAGRIFYSFLTMATVGFFLGMPFPMAMASLNEKNRVYGPWFWGLNGAMGVVSSVFATVISIFLSISATFFIGVLFYIVAMLSSVFFLKRCR